MAKVFDPLWSVALLSGAERDVGLFNRTLFWKQHYGVFYVFYIKYLENNTKILISSKFEPSWEGIICMYVMMFFNGFENSGVFMNAWLDVNAHKRFHKHIKEEEWREEGKNGKMPSETGCLTQREKIRSDKVKGENDQDVLLEGHRGSASWQEGSHGNLYEKKTKWGEQDKITERKVRGEFRCGSLSEEEKTWLYILN